MEHDDSLGREGDYSAYWRGCRCPACKEAARIEHKRYEMRVYRGENDYIVDASKARRRLEELQRRGYTDKELENFGLTAKTVQRIRGGAERIRVSTERKIFAVRGRRMSLTQKVDPREARELVRRWAKAGVTRRTISDVTGVGIGPIDSMLYYDDRKVRVENVKRVVDHREDMESLIVGDTTDRHLSEWEYAEALEERERSGIDLKTLAGRYGIGRDELLREFNRMRRERKVEGRD